MTLVSLMALLRKFQVLFRIKKRKERIKKRKERIREKNSKQDERIQAEDGRLVALETAHETAKRKGSNNGSFKAKKT